MAAKEDYSGDYADTMDTDQKSGPVDSDLQFKKRARRRLVGAIALALFAIIVLPLVMDREPPPIAPEIQVRIPNPEAGNTLGKITTNPNGKPLAAVTKPSVPDAPGAAETSKAVTNGSAGVAQPAESSVKTADAAAEMSQIAPAMPVANPKTSPKAAESKVTATGAGEGKASEKDRGADVVAAKGAPAADGKWVVQLGAYQNTGNVAHLLGKLKELRVPAYTEKVDSPQGPRTRVRAGPFPSRDAALAAQKRIRIIGVEGPVGPMSAK